MTDNDALERAYALLRLHGFIIEIAPIAAHDIPWGVEVSVRYHGETIVGDVVSGVFDSTEYGIADTPVYPVYVESLLRACGVEPSTLANTTTYPSTPKDYDAPS